MPENLTECAVDPDYVQSSSVHGVSVRNCIKKRADCVTAHSRVVGRWKSGSIDRNPVERKSGDKHVAKIGEKCAAKANGLQTEIGVLSSMASTLTEAHYRALAEQ